MLSPAMALACHNSEFNLLSVQSLGNGQYEFEVQFCVGHGCDSTGVGAIGYTHTWAVFIDDASVISFPATLTSPATGAEFTGSNTLYGDTVLIYDRQAVFGWGDTWACIDHTCVPVGQFCISFSFVTQGYPSSLVLGGAEGMGVGVEPYGCNGNDDMRIDLLQPQAGAGADQDVIYGYGSNCIVLSGSATDGVAPYTYAWSNGDNTSSITVCPTETTVYTLTVTDSNGNTSTDDVTVNVTDVTCGNNRVLVCRGGRTRCVRPHRVQRHLDRGGILGACPTSKQADVYYEPDYFALTVYPNPTSDNVALEFIMEDDGLINTMIFGIDGRLVYSSNSSLPVTMGEINRIDIDVSTFTPGIYSVIIESTSGERQTQKLTIVE